MTVAGLAHPTSSQFRGYESYRLFESMSRLRAQRPEAGCLQRGKALRPLSLSLELHKSPTVLIAESTKDATTQQLTGMAAELQT